MPDVLANIVRFQPSLGQRVGCRRSGIYWDLSRRQLLPVAVRKAVWRRCGAHVWCAFGLRLGTVRNLCRMVARHFPPTARKTPQVVRLSHRAQGCQDLRPQFSDHIMSRQAACIAAASSSIVPSPRRHRDDTVPSCPCRPRPSCLRPSLSRRNAFRAPPPPDAPPPPRSRAPAARLPREWGTSAPPRTHDRAR